ncbi:hypothetical protein VKT23_012840 [Stygiomarasmius scandens]|uniref:Uncharacterized protein n=1 Tax=Marasmiellus scandens TaxID=2682957 RepID=A0ABR1J5S0_9AGAR
MSSLSSKQNKELRSAANKILRDLRFTPPTFIIFTQLTPKAEDAISSLSSLLELLDSYQGSPFFVQLLSKLVDDWWSLWSWLALFFKSYATTEAGTGVEGTHDLELRSVMLMKLLKILFHVMNPVNDLELPSGSEDVHTSRFKSLLHNSRGFYTLLVEVIGFGSLHANDVYFEAIRVLYGLFGDKTKDEAIDCFMGALSSSSHFKRMPNFFLCPVLIEFDNQTISINPRKLFLSSFVLRLLIVASPDHQGMFWSRTFTLFIHNLFRRMLRSSLVQRLLQDARSEQHSSRDDIGDPVMIFSAALGTIMQLLTLYAKYEDHCALLVEAGAISTILHAQYVINDPDFQSFLCGDIGSLLDQLLAKPLEVIRDRMIFRGVGRKTIKSVRSVIRNGQEKNLCVDERANLNGSTWCAWKELRMLATESGQTFKRNTINAYWKEMLQCSSLQVSTVVVLSTLAE